MRLFRTGRLLPAVVWVVAGQATLSLSGFLLLIALGRWGSPEALGLFSLGWSVCFLCLSMADTLVYTPTTWLLSQTTHTAERASVLATRTLLVLLTGLLPVCALIALAQALMPDTLGQLGSSLQGAVIAMCLRDFARRHWLNAGHTQLSFGVEWGSSVALLAGLVLLHLTMGLNAQGAMWALAISGVAPLLMRMKRTHLRALWRNVRHIRGTAQACWNYGRWLLMGGLFHVGTLQALPWLAAHAGGPQMAGWWAAGMSVSNAMSPLLTALTNHHRPRFMAAHAMSGDQGLHQSTKASVPGYLMAPWAMCLGAMVAAPDLIRALYGSSFGPTAQALPWLCAVVGLSALAAPAQLALLARGESRSNPMFHGVTLVGLVCGALWWLQSSNPQVEGLACSYLAASALGTLWLWALYAHGRRHHSCRVTQ